MHNLQSLAKIISQIQALLNPRARALLLFIFILLHLYQSARFIRFAKVLKSYRFKRFKKIKSFLCRTTSAFILKKIVQRLQCSERTRASLNLLRDVIKLNTFYGKAKNLPHILEEPSPNLPVPCSRVHMYY
jgi:hypothetical protein